MTREHTMIATTPSSVTASKPAAKPKPRSQVRRIVPVAVLVAGTVTFFALGLQHYISFDTLHEHRFALLAFVAGHGALAPALFVAIYAVATALSLPVGLVLSVTGGFLFGTFLGAAFVVVGATTGAVGVFVIARTALGDMLRRRLASGVLERMADGLSQNAFCYLLVLRLVPLFPFFVVNLVPAFLAVSVRTFTGATLLGIIPGTFVFASVGTGPGEVFEMGGGFSAAGLLTPNVIIALVGLVGLALLPIVYKQIYAR
jgi:uncharacterized membrane protein YdjX (TVP38/TMEM64 family)